MEYEQIISRLAEIKDEMNKPDADMDKLTEETDTLLARRKELEDAAAEKELKRKNLMDQLNAGFKIPEVKTPVEDSDMIERKQFMDYIVTGKLPEDSVLKRADATNVAADMGVMIPHHVQQEIIKEIEKIHGRLYGKVKHTNLNPRFRTGRRVAPSLVPSSSSTTSVKSVWPRLCCRRSCLYRRLNLNWQRSSQKLMSRPWMMNC